MAAVSSSLLQVSLVYLSIEMVQLITIKIRTTVRKITHQIVHISKIQTDNSCGLLKKEFTLYHILLVTEELDKYIPLTSIHDNINLFTVTKTNGFATIYFSKIIYTFYLSSCTRTCMQFYIKCDSVYKLTCTFKEYIFIDFDSTIEI